MTIKRMPSSCEFATAMATGHKGASQLRRGVLLALALALLMQAGLGVADGVAAAQEGRRPLEPAIPSQPETPRHRIRLILKDGSFQTVISYRVSGEVVHYRSAERNGEEEDIPLALVDLPATKAWERAHDPDQPSAAQQAPVLSPELAREEAARQARTPEVATLKDASLRLPEEDSLLVLDTFQGTPELVPLPQGGSDLNRETAHAVLKKDIDPAASPHDLLFLKDERADVQLHVADPVFFLCAWRVKGPATPTMGVAEASRSTRMGRQAAQRPVVAPRGACMCSNAWMCGAANVPWTASCCGCWTAAARSPD